MGNISDSVHIDNTTFGKASKEKEEQRNFEKLYEKKEEIKTPVRERVTDGKQLSFYVDLNKDMKLEFFCKQAKKKKKELLREILYQFLDKIDDEELNKGMASIYAQGRKP